MSERWANKQREKKTNKQMRAKKDRNKRATKIKRANDHKELKEKVNQNVKIII